MFKELSRDMEAVKHNQTKLLEIEAPVSEMKNSVFIIDAGLDTAGEMISKVEDKAIEII